MIKEEKIKKYLKIPVKIRGDAIKTDFTYIQRHEGSEALKKLCKKIKEFDNSFDYKKIKKTEWVPAGWKIILMQLGREMFGWEDKDIINMGYEEPTSSFLIKTSLKYFISIEKNFKEIPKHWFKYWSQGDFIPYKLSIKEKKAIVKLKKFKVHPDICLYILGLIRSFSELILNQKGVEVEESKCVFNGDSFHEFIIKW